MNKFSLFQVTNKRVGYFFKKIEEAEEIQKEMSESELFGLTQDQNWIKIKQDH